MLSRFQHVDPICLCSVRILQKPELAPHVSVAEMGKLLPEEVLRPLEEQYLTKQQVSRAATRPPHWGVKPVDKFRMF